MMGISTKAIGGLHGVRHFGLGHGLFGKFLFIGLLSRLGFIVFCIILVVIVAVILLIVYNNKKNSKG